MVQSIKKYLVGVVVLVLTFIAGYYSKPATVETKVVEKVVSTTDKTAKGTIREREFKDKDGNVKIVRRINYDNKESSKTESDKQSTRTETNQPNNLITITHKFGHQDQFTQGMGLIYQRKLIGSIYVGGFVNRDQAISGGLALTVGF